jgi:hypothetical protein
MNINHQWRNKQLHDNLLYQEIQCLDFLKKHPDITWQWYGPRGHFFDVCKTKINIDTTGNGVVIINSPTKISVNSFIKMISAIVRNDIRVAYMAVNRYEFLVTNNTDICFPDSIDDSIELIASKCNPKFRRLYEPGVVDGKHFVGVHGLDVFVYENN